MEVPNSPMDTYKPKFVMLKREFLSGKEDDYSDLESVFASIVKHSKNSITAKFKLNSGYKEGINVTYYSSESIKKALPGLKKLHTILGEFINKLEKVK